MKMMEENREEENEENREEEFFGDESKSDAGYIDNEM